MKDIKIIFFDIDGTLIDMNKKKMTENIRQTLLKLKENGIKICIATGRSPMQIPYIPNIAFDSFLTYNGSYCFDSRQDIFSNPLKKEDVITIVRNAREIGRPLTLATKSRLAANGSDEDLKEYYGFSGQKIEIADDFEQVAAMEEIYQIMLGCRKDEYEAVMKDVRDARITAWWDRAVDIIPAGGGKGTAIMKILAYYQFDREVAMAFGDGNNDIEMLKAVGTGVAMKNASTELKSIADDICDDVANDGIYFYCKEHGLI